MLATHGQIILVRLAAAAPSRCFRAEGMGLESRPSLHPVVRVTEILASLHIQMPAHTRRARVPGWLSARGPRVRIIVRAKSENLANAACSPLHRVG